MSAQPFGKYQLLRKLATGGMAEVWLAQQTGIEDFKRNVVIKRILPHLAEDAEFVQMFLNEAKIAARFSHPNIAQIFDLGRENGSYFIAMEFVHGEDLGRIMRKAWSAGQWLTKPLALRIIAEACQGLHYAHERIDESTGKPLRVVHRDVSPQNILVSFEGSVKLVDFGIAKAADQASLTRSGAIKGKFAYMSPEQASGKLLDHRSDIFALGLVLYELLTGVRPIKRENDLATLQAALECAIDAPSTVSDVPAELDSVVMKALAKSPDDRYRDARQFQMALEDVLLQRRWAANSVQVSELMSTLFADRLQDEAKQDAVAKAAQDLPPPVDVDVHTPRPTERERPTAAEENWEVGDGDRKSGSGGAQARTTISRPDNPRIKTNPGQESAQGSVPRGEGDWEAPPGPMQIPGHQRRPGQPERAMTGMRSHAASGNGRMPSSVDVPMDASRSRDAARTRDRDGASPPRRSPTPVPRVVDRKATRIAPDADEGFDVDDAQDGEALLSRASTQDPRSVTLARPSTQGPDTLSPEAPPPTWRNGISKKPQHLVEAEVRKLDLPSLPPLYGPNSPPPAPEKAQADDLNAFINVDEMKRRSQQRFQTVIYVSVAFALVLLVFLFRQAIVEAFSKSDLNSQGVLLTVTSSPTVEVFVRHPEEGPESQPVHLGSTPLKEQPGAHLGDTVILESKSQGIHYEEQLKYGTPGSTKEISKRFQKGSFTQAIIPKNVFGLAYYMGDNLVGRYAPNVPVDLTEGEYNLELRGLKLKEPQKVKVKILPGQNTELPPLNIRDKLLNSAGQ